MSDKPSLGAGETLSEWAERAWQARREQEPPNEPGRGAADNGGEMSTDTLEDAIKQRAAKWMEEGQFLVGLVQELLNENEQLRARAAALEQDLQGFQGLADENKQSRARAAALEQDLQGFQKLADENKELRARAAALEQDLQRLRQEGRGLQQEPEDIVEVAPKGDLDMASVGEMKLQDYINAGRIKLVLDLENIEYIDSAGLGEIVRAMKRAREAGGDLRLCGVHGQVGKIIEITGLNKAIAIYPSREEAVASWS
jgi:anti-sigma B factor antagonist